MDLSKLSANGRLALIAGAVVAITALVSIAYGWGLLMAITLVAGLAAMWIVLRPQLTPTMRLPTSTGVALLAAGGVATVVTGLLTVQWLGWIFSNLFGLSAIAFLVCLVASVALLYVGWVEYQAERGPAATAGS